MTTVLPMISRITGNRFQWGAQIGTEWKAFKHLIVYADLTWGLNDIFQKGFRIRLPSGCIRSDLNGRSSDMRFRN